MAAILSTNMASLYAQKNLSTAQASLSESVQRLSSGTRINSAKDDAAGYGIAESVRGTKNIVDQNIRNAKDGISWAQTAEGALDVVGKILQRSLTLTTQAMDPTLNRTQLASIGKELSALGAEINNIAVRTKFQGGSNQVSVFGSTSLNSAGNPQNAGNVVTRSGSISIDTGSSSSTAVAANMVNLAASAGFNTISKGIEGFRLGNPLNTATTAQANIGTGTQFITFESGTENFASTNVTTETDASLTLTLTTGASSSLVGKTLFIAGVDTGKTVASVNADTGVVTMSAALGIALGANDAVSFKGAELSAALSAGDKVFQNGADTFLVIKTGANYAAGSKPWKIEVTGTNVTIAANANIDFLSTANFATAAQVSTIESLIATNSTNRGTLGAAINSLEYAVDNMQTLSTNLADGISRIVDTDYAAETSNLTRTQILQQAATSMLAQANQMPNVILTLLK